MELDFDNGKAIYLQLAEQIEDSIISGVFNEETQIPSTTEISVSYKINPATALKGINLLVDENIIYKKRGVGMFVATGAVDKLTKKHKEQFIENYLKKMLQEAEKLSITKEELISMIERG